MQDDSAHVYFICFPLILFFKEVFAHWEVCLQKEELSLSSFGGVRGVHKWKKSPPLSVYFP